VPLAMSVRDALSLLIAGGGRPLTVIDGDRGDHGSDGDGHGNDGDGSGRVVGLFTLDALGGLLEHDATDGARGAGIGGAQETRVDGATHADSATGAPRAGQ
jgi:CBS domain-containing protein